MNKATGGPTEMYAPEWVDRARNTGAATPTENAAGMATDAGCKPHKSSGWPNSHGRGQSGIDPDALHGESPFKGVALKFSNPCGVRGPLGGDSWMPRVLQWRLM